MKAKNFKVTAKSGSVMIQAADIDGALKVYRLDALDENVLCIRESNFQQPTFSKESVMKVAEKHGAYKEQISNDEWAFNIEDFTLESFIEAICNLTPAVSENMYSVLKILQDAPELNMSNYNDDEVRELNNAMIEAYNILNSLQQPIPVVSDDHNYLQSPGFEHLSNDAQESGIATDHTIVSEQPDVSEVKDGAVAYVLLEEGEESDLMVISMTSYRKGKIIGKRVKWVGSIQPAKGEEWISVEDQLPNSTKNVMCYGDRWNNWYIIQFVNGRFNFKDGSQGANENITHWMPLPPTPEEKGGCKHDPKQNDKLQIICTKCDEILHR